MPAKQDDLLMELNCKNCNSVLTRQGNSQFWECKACGTIYLLNKEEDGTYFLSEKILTEKISKLDLKKPKLSLPINEIKVREIRTVHNAKDLLIKSQQLTREEIIKAAAIYVKNEEWQKANQIITKGLNADRTIGELYVYKSLADAKATKIESLANREFSKNLVINFEKGLSYSNVGFIKSTLNNLIRTPFQDDESTLNAYKIAFPYLLNKKVFGGKEFDQIRDYCFDKVCQNKLEDSFKYLLNTINKKDFTDYINQNLRFARHLSSPEDRLEYINNALKADNSHREANLDYLNLCLKQTALDVDDTFNCIKRILVYSKNPDEDVCSIAKAIIHLRPQSKNLSKLFKKTVGCFSKGPEFLNKYFIDYGYALLEERLFDLAQDYFFISLSIKKNNPKVYWGLCLSDIKAKNNSDITKNKKPLKESIYFDKYIALETEAKQEEALKLANNQGQFKGARIDRSKNTNLMIKKTLRKLYVFLILLVITAISFVGAIVLSIVLSSMSQEQLPLWIALWGGFSAIALIVFLIFYISNVKLYKKMMAIYNTKYPTFVSTGKKYRYKSISVDWDKIKKILIIIIVAAIVIIPITVVIVNIINSRQHEQQFYSLENLTLTVDKKENAGNDKISLEFVCSNKSEIQMTTIQGTIRISVDTYEAEESIAFGFSNPITQGHTQKTTAQFYIHDQSYQHKTREAILNASLSDLKLDFRYEGVKWGSSVYYTSYICDFITIKEKQ